MICTGERREKKTIKDLILANKKGPYKSEQRKPACFSMALSLLCRNRPRFKVIHSAGETHNQSLSAPSTLDFTCPLGGATVSINWCGSTTPATLLTGELKTRQPTTARAMSFLLVWNWLFVLVILVRLTGETVVTAFDLDRMYTPFHFARVKSYTASSKQPLWALV